jgi:formylglycine-generating enzyme required for sulfatase activity
VGAALCGCGRIGFGDDGTAAPVGGSHASCANLEPVCGAMHDTSCCDDSLFGGGMFFRNRDVAADMLYADTGFPATLGAFRIDRFEVTVGRFRAFIDAGGAIQLGAPEAGSGAHPRLADSGWDSAWDELLVADAHTLIASFACGDETWTDEPGANETRPMNCVNWYEAMAFCIWDGGFLPTEAEWNFAAVNGSEQRAYPWSVPPDSVAIDETRASYAISGNCRGDGMDGCGVTDLVPVGSKPAGDGVGTSDMAGNVNEWTLDWSGTVPVPCDDCANLVPEVRRRARGGDYRAPPEDLRSAERSGAVMPVNRYEDLGLRCARVP